MGAEKEFVLFKGQQSFEVSSGKNPVSALFGLIYLDKEHDKDTPQGKADIQVRQKKMYFTEKLKRYFTYIFTLHR